MKLTFRQREKRVLLYLISGAEHTALEDAFQLLRDAANEGTRSQLVTGLALVARAACDVQALQNPKRGSPRRK